MRGTACDEQRNMPVRCVPITAAQSSYEICPTRPERWMPALFTRTSTRPSSASIDSNARATLAGSETSVVVYRTPSRGSVGSSLSRTTIRAPASRNAPTIAWPIPPAPPVPKMAPRSNDPSASIGTSGAEQIDILKRARLRSEPIPEPIRTPAVPRAISGAATRPPAVLTWSEELGKRIRTGDPADQAVSTVTKIAQSIDAGQWEPAAQLVDYFMEEAKVVFVIYTSWSEGFEDYLRFKEVPREDAEGEQARLRARLALDPERQWLELAAAAGLLANRLRAFLIQADEAHAKLDELRDGWRRLHDAY